MSRKIEEITFGTIAAFVLASSFFAAPARADDAYPKQTVRIVVGVEPGAVVDFSARQIAAHLAEELGVSVVVENRSGAGGHLAFGYVSRAAPDGYTLAYHDSSLITAPMLGQKLDYDAKKSLRPVSIAASGAFFLYGNPANKSNTIQEVVRDLKANPNRYFYGTAGVGAMNHIGFELFSQETGTTAKSVAYKGSGPTKIDIMANRIHFSMSSAPGILSDYKAGNLKIFAYGGAERSPILPDVPTMSETVAPGLKVGNWFGFSVPAGTDDAIVDRLNKAVVAAMKKPQLVEALQREGVEPLGLSRPETEAFLNSESDRWAKVIEKAGIKLSP